MRQRLDRATRNFLEADPELVPDLNAKLRDMRQELHQAEQRLTMVEATRNGGTVANFIRWWAEVKPQLLRIDTEGGPIRDYTAVIPPGPIYTDPATFRGFLSSIGLEINVRWKEQPKPGRDRRYVPDRLDIAATVRWEDKNPAATVDRSSCQ